MRTIHAFTCALLLGFVACSDSTPAPSCTVDCDAGAPEGGSGGSPEDGSAQDVIEEGSAPKTVLPTP